MNRFSKFSRIISGLLLTTSIFSLQAEASDNGSGGKFVVRGRILGLLNRYKATKEMPVTIGTTVTNPSTTTAYTANTANGQISVPSGSSSTLNMSYNVNNTISYGSTLGVELSGSYFLTDKIAMALDIAYIQKKLKINGVFNELATDSNTGTSFTSGLNGSYAINTVTKLMPISIIAQYHIAPYGRISPYFGLGYNYTLASASAGSKLGSSRGPVFQVGFDSFVYNDILINVDVKKMLVNTKLNFDSTASGSGGAGGFSMPEQKLQLNPMVASIGVGYRF